MFKFLLKNPKRILRNLAIILIGFVVALILFMALSFFLEAELSSVPLFLIVGITGVGLFLAMLLTIAILGYVVNKRDSELRRRYRAEVNSTDTSSIALANGVQNLSVVNTSRDAKTIKKELVDLQIELYHANERDKNLKLSKKF